VRYCGRLITKDGVRFDPKNIDALQTMQEPQNGADLVQYVGAVNWMRSAIPNYSKRVAPLQAALAKVFEGKSRRTKKAAAAVSLLHLWAPEKQAAFKDLQAAIMDSMTLNFPDPDKKICVLTDASDRFYAGLVTQIDVGAAGPSDGRARLPASSFFCQASSKARNYDGQYQRRKVSPSSTQ
jgi:RNase H-like domain found in reverse transcriptase